MSRPTLYLSNFASARTPGRHGPGRVWTIMRRPAPYHFGEGRVSDLMPEGVDLDAIRAGQITIEEYARRFRATVESARLPPGTLTAYDRAASARVLVADGDTLCCACGVARAKAGECHRVFAAGLLFRAGWDLVLDGERMVVPDA